MPLDGEEHARAEHESLECNEDYRDPIHHFEYFLAESGANVGDCHAKMVLLYALMHTIKKQFPYIETKCPSRKPCKMKMLQPGCRDWPGTKGHVFCRLRMRCRRRWRTER